MRQTGDPYITHPLIVTEMLAEYGMDEATLVAAILHDIVEDTEVDAGRASQASSATKSPALIDGVTKLDRIKFSSREEHQAATIRKMAIAMAQDIRVLLIKLADRLHNIRTLAPLPCGEAAAHRRGDARGLRAAGAPARCAGDQARDGGALLRSPLPEAQGGDRGSGSPRAPEREEYLEKRRWHEVSGRLAEAGIEARRSPDDRSTSTRSTAR